MPKASGSELLLLSSAQTAVGQPKICRIASLGDLLCSGQFLSYCLVLWLLGIVSSYTIGGYIHLLLVIAVVVVLIRLIQGRTPV